MLAVSMAAAAPAATITVGNYIAAPGWTNFPITILVSGGDPVAGINLALQVDAQSDLTGVQPGEPLFEYDGVDQNNTAWDGVGGDVTAAGTIFGPNNTGFPAHFESSTGDWVYMTVTTNSGTVPASGVLAYLSISTVGAAQGLYDLNLFVDVIGSSDFAGVPATLINGTILIPEPEPASIVLGLFAAVGFSFVALRRRRRSRAWTSS